ncbi:MAG: metalloregulator ArsR/SmtB family transcription factor [Chloroflexi bacterium]|nr:metalloregulator ArsR/SmtB family transcription factor [Chloroflexota bacterium]MDA8187065.1 metalloregulator ArsR/SmtB family transcription factor [Dehalococcoidales bacterium]
MAGRVAQDLREADLPVDAPVWAALTALADPVRLRIILMLREREQCVCHLTETLGLSQGTVSYHMGLLKRAGLVQDRRDLHDARWVYYKLDPVGVAAFQTTLRDILDTTRADATLAACCDSEDRGVPNKEEV